jgi:hypothetical protein
LQRGLGEGHDGQEECVEGFHERGQYTLFPPPFSQGRAPNAQTAPAVLT